MNNLDRFREELLALFSHELKTPLTLITGWCQVLTNPKIVGKLNHEQLQALNVVSANAARLRNEIDDILDTNKLIYGTMLFLFEDIDADKLVQRIIGKLKPVTDEKNINIVSLVKEKTLLRTDPYRLEQIITNLILNSIDFVPKNNGIIKIGVKEESEQVTFFVIDNGKGIPKKMQEKIFEKLVQEDSSYRRRHHGLGLGLFLCTGIIESLGGKIWVESKLNKGSTFYFIHPKYGNTGRFSLLRQKSHMAISELYQFTEKKIHREREQEMIRRLRAYVEKMKDEEFVKSVEKIAI
ncbi:MAG TPA: HAMP domain-containing sensor histidine kinase [Nitrosopumilaceae archaeon]|nr:HAMP domain-containing sensor histidine kinase [Nitrosopumilaceae archaeon]